MQDKRGELAENGENSLFKSCQVRVNTATDLSCTFDKCARAPTSLLGGRVGWFEQDFCPK